MILRLLSVQPHYPNNLKYIIYIYVYILTILPLLNVYIECISYMLEPALPTTLKYEYYSVSVSLLISKRVVERDQIYCKPNYSILDHPHLV